MRVRERETKGVEMEIEIEMKTDSQLEVVEDKKRREGELVNRSLGSLGIHRPGEEVERKKEAERVKGEK